MKIPKRICLKMHQIVLQGHLKLPNYQAKLVMHRIKDRKMKTNRGATTKIAIVGRGKGEKRITIAMTVATCFPLSYALLRVPIISEIHANIGIREAALVQAGKACID